MKQHVNLHRLEFDAPRPKLPAVQMGGIGLGAMLLGLAIWGGVEWRNQRAADAVEGLRARRAAESSRVVELASLYPPRPVDAALEGRVTGLARERDAKRRLLGLLSSESLGNTTGFSGHVSGLARRRLEGVWLQTIRLEAGGRELVLEGRALDPSLVPRFLRGLGEESAFVGSEFRSLRIERSAHDPQQVEWSARTRESETPFEQVLR